MNPKGNLKWNKEDKEMNSENTDDRPYVKMPEQIMRERRELHKKITGVGQVGEDILGRNDSEEDLRCGQGSKQLHKEEFSLLF